MNRLQKATSPYLLQHATNPVDWWPWCDEAFEEAKKRDLPIFLSIGYATCHWCHVMAHESFESDVTAEQMNRQFINIKLDREERPDLDGIYMAALQATQGNGGWPMSVFIDHEKRPFFLATYLPPEDRHGRPSFKTVMSKMSSMWGEARGELLANAEGITDFLQKQESSEEPEGVPSDQIDRLAFTAISSRFDSREGGLGTRPKFPTTHVYDYLLRLALRGVETTANLKMVDLTLRKLFEGGIHDHVGGGFHRYSTDELWLLPHFEKMLYDQAQILRTATLAWQMLQDPIQAEIAKDILGYLRRDLRNPEGGYFSGEDADSEGEEGTFYVFTEAELIEVLGEEDGAKAAALFGVSKEGNFHDEATGQRTGANILHLKGSIIGVSFPSLAEYHETAAPMLAKLADYRNKRPRPLCDDKVIASWNGLMISGLSEAALAFPEEPAFLSEAAAAAAFVTKDLGDEEGELIRSWRLGQNGHGAFLEDYAAVGLGLLDFFAASGETKSLARSVELAEAMLEHFWDAEGKAFYRTRADAPDVIVRQKEAYDGAEPSGNALAAELMLRLGHMLGRDDFREAGEGVLAAFAESASRSPSGHTRYLCSLDFYHATKQELVIAASNRVEAAAMLAVVGAAFTPNLTLVLLTPENASELAKWLPWVEAMEIPTTGARAYLCEGMACQAPIESAEALQEAIGV